MMSIRSTISISRIVSRRSIATSSVRLAERNPLNQEQKGAMESVGDTIKKAGQALKSDGSVGSKFEKGGEVAEIGEAVGGPFSSEGAVGKQFTDKGAIGGTGQAAAEVAENAGKDMKKP